MKTVHLICKQGPEWNIPVVAYTNPMIAEVRAVELDHALDKTNGLDRLSGHVVIEIEVKDE